MDTENLGEIAKELTDSLSSLQHQAGAQADRIFEKREPKLTAISIHERHHD